MGLDLEPPLAEAGKKLIWNSQPVQHPMEAMYAELIEQTHREVEGEFFCLSALLPKDDSWQQYMLQAFKAVSDPDNMYLH